MNKALERWPLTPCVADTQVKTTFAQFPLLKNLHFGESLAGSVVRYQLKTPVTHFCKRHNVYCVCIAGVLRTEIGRAIRQPGGWVYNILYRWCMYEQVHSKNQFRVMTLTCSLAKAANKVLVWEFKSVFPCLWSFFYLLAVALCLYYKSTCRPYQSSF